MMFNKNINADLSKAIELAKSDIKNRHINTYAGILWNIGVPLLYAMINVIVFSILMSSRMGNQYGDVPFALFYFVPLSLWSIFSDIIVRSTGILREYSYLITKISFPYWVLPLVPLASALIGHLIIVAITVALMIYHGIAPANTVYFYVVIWLITVLLALGISYIMSAISVYIPDLAQIVPVFMNILFWITPILYPANIVTDNGPLWVRSLIMDYNPMYYIVESSRYAVFGSAHVSWAVMGFLFLLSLTIFFVGYSVFRKLKSGFADVI